MVQRSGFGVRSLKFGVPTTFDKGPETLIKIYNFELIGIKNQRIT